MKQIRVVHVSTVHGRNDVRIFHKMCRSLMSEGYQVTFIVQDGQGREIIEGIEIVDLGRPPTGRIRRIILSPWIAWRYLRKMKAGIVHFHDPELLLVGWLLQKKNIKVIYDAHEDYRIYFRSKEWIPIFLRNMVAGIFAGLESFISRRLTAVVGATPTITKRFTTTNPRSINVNNYPCFEEFLPSSEDRSLCRTLCYVGLISRQRGIFELLAALKQLPDVRLIICGPLENDSFLTELEGQAGWSQVEYHGVVGRPTVAEIMARSTIGMVTLLPYGHHLDALPVKMFEYMAAGLPVIASNFPLWRSIVEEMECGILVDPSLPCEIACAIKSLLDDPNKCRALGKAGQEAILKKFNWSNEMKKLLSLYKRISPHCS